jgi:hypothetical protein
MMTIEDVMKKAILPLAAMTFWCWLVNTIMKVSGYHEPIIFLFFSGLPFGAHKIYCVLVSRGLNIGGTAGMAALSVIAGGVMGFIMIPYYMIRAVYVLIRYIISTIKKMI